MSLATPIDGYCERLDASLWSEPINALTNLAFVLAAIVMWPRVQGLLLARVLCVILALIGLSSGFFHTWAVSLTAALDSLSILAFVLVYIYGANRVFWEMRKPAALGVTALFFPYAAGVAWIFSHLSWLGGSAGYMPVALLILGYAFALREKLPETARGLAIGAGILLVSIAFRTADLHLCPSWPMGTHWLWHILNAIMLGWMIEVFRRNRLGEWD